MAEDGHTSEEQVSLIKPESGCKLYKRRWLMLFIFAIFSMSNYYLWGQYAAIFTAVRIYYNTTRDIVDLLSSTSLVTYVVAIVPVMWLTEKTDLKIVLIVGTVFQCVGAWIRYIGTLNYNIPLNFIGQTLCAMSQPCCFGMSSQMAGTWFGIDEVALSNGIGFAAVEIGVGLALIICPQVIYSGPDLAHQMDILFLWTAIIMTLIVPLTIFVFEAEPPLPPSRPRMNLEKAGKQESAWKSLWFVCSNWNFMLLLFANTFNLAFLSLIIFKLDETLSLTLTTNANVVIQYVGLAKILAVIVGPMAAGHWLDKSRSFRRTFIASVFCNAVTVFLFTLSIYLDCAVCVVIDMVIYEFFAACTIIIGFEYAIELTYPEPEIMSSGLLNAAGYAFACVMMLLYDVVLAATNIWVTMIMFIAMMLFAFVLSIFVSDNYLRQRADQDDYEGTSLNDSEMTKRGE
ncbi:uncharacterized MFS-type transporter C09D4.1-like isoform X2 [Anneissia japonica]|uniref:uncharacterized MFS-type transporter C09D4.1-like isoform X2 n=1 Tax=Anneissia japonica TaxID=1529436 RepID=UPI0014259023|nr:uncharacterized MFS-type transporter C09D4.1-like isoform X2 [Anneissia japonica]